MDPAAESNNTGSHTCPWWLLFTFDNPLRRLIRDPAKILSPCAASGSTVLDVGCGMGYFTIGLAELVGPNGTVIAVDLQPQVLAGLQKRATRTGLLNRIQMQQSTVDHLGTNEPLDFALAFWMVHEVRQPRQFLKQIYALLKPAANFLVVEPRIHVSGKAFRQTELLAKSIGFHVTSQPKVRASRAVLFSR